MIIHNTLTYSFNLTPDLKKNISHLETTSLHFAKNSYFMPILPTIYAKPSHTMEELDI